MGLHCIGTSNPIAAERFVNSIMDAVDQLADFLKAGAPLTSVADVESDYRFLVTGNSLTFYRVYENEVFVDRVLYGRRDYLRILFGDIIKEDIIENRTIREKTMDLVSQLNPSLFLCSVAVFRGCSNCPSTQRLKYGIQPCTIMDRPYKKFSPDATGQPQILT